MPENKIFNPQLTIIHRDEKRRVHLMPGRTTIGRRSDNAVVIPDRTVSGHHAVIIVEDNQVIIEDLGSSNGTFVGRRKVTMPCKLSGDEHIRVGMCGLFFSMNNVDSQMDDDSENPFANSMLKAEVINNAFKPTTLAKKTVSNAYLEYINGGKPGITRLELDKTVNPIGCLGTGVAAISFGKNGWALSHVDGINPLHNDRIVRKDSALLQSGDIIEIGDLKVRFMI